MSEDAQLRWGMTGKETHMTTTECINKLSKNRSYWSKVSKLEQFNSDVEYFNSHRDELLKKYPESYVAVHRGQIIATTKTVEEIAKAIAKVNTPSDEIVVMFLSTKHVMTLY
jgi:hypothetical protein